MRGDELDFLVLGPLEVRSGGRALDPPPPRQRALLALLIIHVGTPLSTDRILEELWGDDIPAGGAGSLRFHVSKLRGALEPDRPRNEPSQVIATRAGGYVLEADPADIDAARFEALVARAMAMVDAEPARSGELLTEAEGLWRGDAYADVRYEEFAQAEIHRLEALRMSARLARIGCEIETGRHAEVLAEIERLTEDHPLDEQLAGLQMTALYRSGKPAEALGRFEALRKRLGDKGMDPSPELFRLEEQILVHDRDLHPPRPVRSRTNLPSPASTLIGRDAECRAITRTLAERRLVTLHGPGGIGKSRLAIAAAEHAVDQFTDGVWHADLSTAETAEDLSDAVLETLGLEGATGPELANTLRRHVADRQLLLVLDGGEHLADDLIPLCRTLLTAGPGIHLLVTSRRRLRVAGEAVFEVLPLSLEPEGDEPSPAVVLFLERAKEASGLFDPASTDLATVEIICRELDGIPLAIELAASRTPVLSVSELAERLGRDLATLGRRSDSVRPERDETIEAVMRWSYDLLEPEERLLLDRLAVLRGGFTLDAAETICADDEIDRIRVLDLLERLVDASFVGRPPGSSRFSMLRVIRDFAAARLSENSDRTDLDRRHRQHFADFAARADAGLRGDEQTAWLERLDVDRFNLADAYRSAVKSDERELAVRLAANLVTFLLDRGYHREGRSLLSDVIELTPEPATLEEVSALAGLAVLAQWSGHRRQATDLARLVTSNAAVSPDAAVSSRIARLEATMAWARGRYVEAADAELAALAAVEGTGDPSIAQIAGQAAYLLLNSGRNEEAERVRRLLHELAPEAPPDVHPLLADVDAWFALYQGDDRRAAELWMEAGDRYEAIGLRAHLADVAGLAAWAAFESGDFDRAGDLAETALGEAREIEAQFFEARGASLLSWIDATMGPADAAGAHLAAALRFLHRTGDDCWMAWHLGVCAGHLAGVGDVDTAATTLGAAAALAELCGVVAPASAAARLDHLEEHLRSTVGEGYEAARGQGDAMPLDQVVPALSGWLTALT